MEIEFVRPSVSPRGDIILFVKKKNISCRLCVDYTQLNKATLENRYPLPRRNSLMEQLRRASIF